MRGVVTELMEVWPDATKGVLGAHDVYRHQDETPAHMYEAVIKSIPGPRLIDLTARDSFDDRLAAFLLDSVEEAKLPALGSGKIRVFAAKFPVPWSFECVVVVPPKIAGRFDHQSARLKRITYWVVPAFAYEFRDGEGSDGFWLQVRRPRRVERECDSVGSVAEVGAGLGLIRAGTAEPSAAADPGRI